MGSNSNSVSDTTFILHFFFPESGAESSDFKQITVKLNLTHFRLSLYTSGLSFFFFFLFCFSLSLSHRDD